MSDSNWRFGEFLVELGFVTQVQVREALELQPLTGKRIGETLISLGFLTRSQLQRAVGHAIDRGDRLIFDRPLLGELLVGLQYIDADQLSVLLELQKSDPRRLGELAVDRGFVSPEQMLEALGLQSRMTAPAQNRSEAGETAPSNLPRRPRLVVVDDSTLACSMVEQGLKSHGYEVVTFSDPFLALEQLEALHPALLLTDLEMPGMSGPEVCQRVKSSRNPMPVIILTGNDADAQRVGGLRAGADDYVYKGASMEELVARVESVLRRTRETQRVRQMFARYTSDAIVEEVLNSGDVVLAGERRVATLLFADIRGFTSLAESMAPEAVMRMLSEILGNLADVVLEYGGTLDKFLGDGLMAVWGAPVRHDDDAERATLAACRMIKWVHQYNQKRSTVTPIELGIGLNTGIVIAGSIGSLRRTEYTCIGDAVNVASRLCSMAAPHEILLGETTARTLERYGPLETLAPVRMKGKAQLVSLFRLTGALCLALDGLGTAISPAQSTVVG